MWWVEIETSNFVDRLIVASASPGWQTITERGMVRSREPFKFRRAPTNHISEMA